MIKGIAREDGTLILDFDELIEYVRELKNDLLYVLEQLDGYLDKGWTIDLNFTGIREKYKEDIKEYENWK